MTYPNIHHIEDVLPAIEGRSDFIVADRDGYTVVDYVYTLSDSFDCPIRRECRGIKFDDDGNILARPLHKFFNINERPETQADKLDFTRPYTVMEKLDGSMIHAAMLDGEVVFMTRMGRTDVAVKAERHLSSTMQEACRRYIESGLTPIFEFTAPDNRIVIQYSQSKLTVLAARDIFTGEYVPTPYGCPVVSSAPKSGPEFAEFARAVTGMEGFVVRFADGTWIKAKGEDYVIKHRAKDSILQEKNVLQLVVNGGVDDVLPLLDDSDRRALQDYQAQVMAGIVDTETMLIAIVAANDNLPQKQFATEVVEHLRPALKPLAFSVRSGRAAHEVITETIKRKATTQTRVDELRPLFKAQWAI